MSVYRPKNTPFYHYDFRHKGVRFYGSTGEKTERKALQVEGRKRSEAKEELASGGAPKLKRITLNTATERFYQEVAQHEANAATVDYQLERITSMLGADTFLDDITTDDLTDYQRRRRGQKTKRGGFPANRTVNAEVPELYRRIWRRAKLWRVARGDEPEWSDLILPIPEERSRELTAEEERRLFEHLRTDLHPIVRFAILSGLRLDNLVDVQWHQVDLDAKVLTVKTKSKKPGRTTLRLPLTGPMIAILSAQRGNHKTAVFTYLCQRKSARRVKGRRYAMTLGALRRPFRHALRDAQIPDFRFHDLRHTAGSRTARVANLKVVQRQLGHRTIQSAARYAHVQDDDVRAAMDAAHSRNIPEVVAGEDAETDTKALKAKGKR